MSVHVDLIGSIGDALFQYAFGRLLAEHHRLSLTIAGAWVHHLRQLGLEELDGGVVAEPYVDVSSDTVKQWDLHTVEPDQLFTASPARFHLRGYFQRIGYFESQFERISRWYANGGAPPGTTYDTVVHIARPPAFAQRGWLLPSSYYRQALDRAPSQSVVFCGDVLGDGVAALADAYGAMLTPTDGFDVLSLARSAQTVITSNDTISWWAAALSSATHIIAPHSANGRGYAFTGYSSVDLEMRARRYSKIPVETFITGSIRIRSLIVGATLFESADRLTIAAGRQPTHIVAAAGEKRFAAVLVTVPVIELSALRRQLGDLISVDMIRSFVEKGFCRLDVVSDEEPSL